MNNRNQSTGRLPRRTPLRAAIAAVTLTLAGTALAEQSATEPHDPTQTQSEYEAQTQTPSEYGAQSEQSTQMGDTAQTENFDELDEDGDGYLDQSELAQSETAGAVLEELDSDNDGQVSRTEFAALESATMGSGAQRTEDSWSSGGTETDPSQDTGTETDTSDSTWSSDDPSSSTQSSSTQSSSAHSSTTAEETASSSDSSWSSGDTSSTASTDTSASQSGDTGMSDAGQSENAQAVAQIAEQQESLSTFTQALQETGIADALTDSDNYTIFAPTNEAFEARSGKSAEELMKPENREELVSLLRAHIVADDVDEEMVQKISEARTLDGGTVSVASQDGELKIGDASVVESEIEQGSLRVYPIDAVLEPQAGAQMAATDTGLSSDTDSGSTQQLSEMDFDELDQDGDGYLTDEELQGAEGVAATTSAGEMDTDQDGQVSRTEFAAFEQSPDAGQSPDETDPSASSWESDRSEVDEPEGSQYESQPDPQ